MLNVWDLTMQENSSQIKLNLETNVHICSVDLLNLSVTGDFLMHWSGLIHTVGLHHKVKRRLGIWFSPDRWAFVSFLNFIDLSGRKVVSQCPKRNLWHFRIRGTRSSKPLAFSQKRPSHEGNAVACDHVSIRGSQSRITCLEECMLKNRFNPSKCLNTR